MKHLFFSLLTVLGLSLSSAIWADDTITNYFCDFEDTVQNKTWHFPSSDDVPHAWHIGRSVNNGGQFALYVAPKGLQAAAYLPQAAMVYAYVDITLAQSSEKYLLSFDWMAAGYTPNNIDGLYVFWVPDFDDLGNPITIQDAGNNAIPSQLADYALRLRPSVESDCLNGQSTWQVWVSEKKTESDSRLRGGKHRRLVFAWRNGNDGPINPGACIDNISIVDSRSCEKPTDLTFTTVGQDSLIVEWKGDANQYEVGCFSYENNAWTIERVTTPRCVYKNVQEGYNDFYVRTVCYDERISKEYFGPKTQSSRFIYYPDNHCIDYITLTDENCYVSTQKTKYVTEDYRFEHQMVDEGSNSKSSRHTHHYSKIETDPQTGGRLRTVPDGELVSTRLGNWNNGGEAERAEFIFNVDANKNPILVLKYAVVLESPGHDRGKKPTDTNLEDPRFTLDVLHKGRSIGSCASADYTSSWVSDGWNDTLVVTNDGEKNVVWKDWTTVGVNLEDYDGEQLTIQLTTYDCSINAHFGYAYFTLGCAKKELEGRNCDGRPSTDFKAPAGFNYRWYRRDDPTHTILSTDQSLTIDSTDARIYNVDVIFPEDTSCFFTLQASSQPHYAVADFTYRYTPHDCKNYVTITNNSHAETVDLMTHDTLVSDVDSVVWSFPDGRKEYIAPGETKQVEFAAEGGTFPVSVTAFLENCASVYEANIVIPHIGEHSRDTVVYRCPGSPYRFVGHHADGTPYTRDEQYVDNGTYRDTLRSFAGCDSIIVTHLNVLRADTTGSAVVILQGQSYDFHGKTLTVTGTYRDTLRSVFGCDSVIDTLNLYVHEALRVELTEKDSLCPNTPIWSLPFRLVQGRSCSRYSLTWRNADFCNIDSANLPADNVITYYFTDNCAKDGTPLTLTPNYYTAHVIFYDSLRKVNPVLIRDAEMDVQLCILYPEEVVTQRWNDVLAVRNKDYNGGYTFDAYQWYKNGVKLNGETGSYLYQPLDFSASYQVRLTRSNDRTQIFTCPVIPHQLTSSEDIPTLVRASSSVAMQGQGQASWYDVVGNKVEYELYDNSNIMAPSKMGIYILVLETDENVTSSRVVVH